MRVRPVDPQPEGWPRLVEARIVLEDGRVSPIVLRVEVTPSGGVAVSGHSRPIALPKGARLEADVPMPA